jgi:hypothetical protein
LFVRGEGPAYAAFSAGETPLHDTARVPEAGQPVRAAGESPLAVLGASSSTLPTAQAIASDVPSAGALQAPPGFVIARSTGSEQAVLTERSPADDPAPVHERSADTAEMLTSGGHHLPANPTSSGDRQLAASGDRVSASNEAAGAAADMPRPSASRWTVISPRQPLGAAARQGATGGSRSTPHGASPAQGSSLDGATSAGVQRSGEVVRGFSSPPHTVVVHQGSTIQRTGGNVNGTNHIQRTGGNVNGTNHSGSSPSGGAPLPLRSASPASRTIQRYRDASSSSGTPLQPNGPDLHLIAQQVYRILKQRLLLERERAGLPRG